MRWIDVVVIIMIMWMIVLTLSVRALNIEMLAFAQ